MSKTTSRYVGEQITVTDFYGVRGPATITEVSTETGSFEVRPDFPHYTPSTPEDSPWEVGTSWFFFADEKSDFGLTLTFEPFQPVPYDAGSPLPSETRFGTLITFEGTPLRDLDREGLIRVIEYLGPQVHPEVFGRTA